MTHSRAALLEWLRNVVPDIRIGHGFVDGKRACFAKFTVDGDEHEVSADGDEPDDEIVRVVADMVRASLDLPPLLVDDKTVRLEQDIVLASIAGDTDQCERLTRQLVMGRPPRALQAQTKFIKREIW